MNVLICGLCVIKMMLKVEHEQLSVSPLKGILNGEL